MRQRKNLFQLTGKVIVLESKIKKKEASKTRKAPYDFVGKKKRRDHFLSNEKSLFLFVAGGKFKFFRELSKFRQKSSVKTVERMNSHQHRPRRATESYTSEEDKLIL
jgi:hypothetical protein